MTLIEGLIVVCVALIVIYLVVRYQRSGEVFQISWHKTKVKETETKTLPDAKLLPQIALPSTATNGGNVQINLLLTNSKKPETNRTISPSPGNAGVQFFDQRKQTVLILTNATTNKVWFRATPRKQPGVRIAFP